MDSMISWLVLSQLKRHVGKLLYIFYLIRRSQTKKEREREREVERGSLQNALCCVERDLP